MSVKYHLLNIILLYFVCFSPSTGQTSTSNTATEQTSLSNTATGQASTSNIATGQISTSNAATGQTSTSNAATGSSPTSNAAIGSSPTSNAVTGSLPTSNAATGSSPTSNAATGTTSISNAATGQTSTFQSTQGNTGTSGSNAVTSFTSLYWSSATSAVTTAPITTNINATYQYSIFTNVSLQTGQPINNSNVTNSVTNLIQNSFNLTSIAYNISILQIQIQSGAKAFNNYYLLVSIQFTISITCDINCINQRKLNITTSILLPNINGTLVSVSATTTTTTTATTTTVIYPVGGPSPGLPGQLGMGLGISFIGVLLIAEIIFLYWKYGLSNSSRREQYAMTHY